MIKMKDKTQILFIIFIIIMYITYGFVFYFLLFILTFNFLLIFLLNRTIRHALFKFVKDLNIADSELLNSILYVISTILFVVLVDSLWTYIQSIGNMEEIEKKMQNIMSMKYHESYQGIGVYRKYREFHNVERNLMLMGFTFFVYFVFQKLVEMIGEICELELKFEQLREQQAK